MPQHWGVLERRHGHHHAPRRHLHAVRAVSWRVESCVDTHIHGAHHSSVSHLFFAFTIHAANDTTAAASSAPSRPRRRRRPRTPSSHSRRLVGL